MLSGAVDNTEKDKRNISSSVRRLNRSEKRKQQGLHRVVEVDENGSPQDLLGGGEHFDGVPQDLHAPPSYKTPMDEMVESVRQQELLRPVVKERRVD